MSSAAQPEDRGYDRLYAEFESPLTRRLRQEAYGKDIGQHSWTTAEELEGRLPQLRLSTASRVLDLGCGPGGPLAFVVAHVGCHGLGIDRSIEALSAGRARTASLEPGGLIALVQADLNDPTPFAAGSFDAAISLDTVLHLRDRLEVFGEVKRVLVPGGRFLFTDAGVIAASLSNDEIGMRAFHGYTQFVPPGFNERMLQLAGFHLVDRTDCTASVLKNATGRRSARLAHQAEIEQVEGCANFERQQQYLEAVIGLSQRGAMSRFMYLAESPAS